MIISEMQHKLATWVASDPARQFRRLLRLIVNRDWLAEAARIVLASSSASTPGVDGIDKHKMQRGLEDKLDQLQDDLLQGTYYPQPVKRIYIEKANGKLYNAFGYSHPDRPNCSARHAHGHGSNLGE
jgi:retron-type reverse transcriptase